MAGRRAVRIRRAVVSEAQALSALAFRSKALWGYDNAFMALCRAELTVQPEAIEAGEVWVAEQDSEIVGLTEIVAEGRSAEIRLIFVASEAVRSGVGRALWRHAELRARTLGAEAIHLDADPNSVGFYERMGMRVVGESPSGSVPGRTLPRMQKRLRSGPAPR